MGLLSWLGGGNDRQLAADRYASRESASDKAARKRRSGHRRSIAEAAAAGEKWERKDRARDRKGGWRRTDWSD
ncbi:hypothetical protein [Streptomyces sp. NPDC093591]|uniref:hypothetical protein n=1 Tax=Streptomyces sp. NPDC093591 TaxID=3366044 RepID=UPI0037F6C65E